MTTRKSTTRKLVLAILAATNLLGCDQQGLENNTNDTQTSDRTTIPTGYPQSVFENVPPTVLSWYDITPISLSAPMPTEMKVPTELAAGDVAAVFRWLANDETQKLINAERNYSSQAIQIVEDGRVRALKLIKSIESATR